MKLAVMISGTGTNLTAIIEAARAGELDAEIELVVSSNQRAKGIERAREAGIDVMAFTPADYEADPEAVDEKIARAFQERGVEYVAMAGYMRKVTPVLLDAYPNRVVNLHPALLPEHPGAHAIRDAYEAGDSQTGITIHFANEEYDQGPIIFQHAVDVREGESLEELEARIHEAEHTYYPKVLQAIAEGRVSVEGGRCVVAD